MILKTYLCIDASKGQEVKAETLGQGVFCQREIAFGGESGGARVEAAVRDYFAGVRATFSVLEAGQDGKVAVGIGLDGAEFLICSCKDSGERGKILNELQFRLTQYLKWKVNVSYDEDAKCVVYNFNIPLSEVCVDGMRHPFPHDYEKREHFAGIVESTMGANFTGSLAEQMQDRFRLGVLHMFGYGVEADINKALDLTLPYCSDPVRLHADGVGKYGLSKEEVESQFEAYYTELERRFFNEGSSNENVWIHYKHYLNYRGNFLLAALLESIIYDGQRVRNKLENYTALVKELAPVLSLGDLHELSAKEILDKGGIDCIRVKELESSEVIPYQMKEFLNLLANPKKGSLNLYTNIYRYINEILDPIQSEAREEHDMRHGTFTEACKAG